MKKFITVFLLASAAVFGAAAEAEFYNDFEYDRIPVEAVRDGVGYVAFGDYFDMPFLKARADGDGYVVYGDGYTLEVTPGTSAAVFNGESIELPAAPYVTEHGLCMPARTMFSLAEVYVAYDDISVPGRLPYKEYYDGSDGAETVRVLGPLDGSYLTISHSPDIDNILSDDIFTLGLYAMYEKAEPVEINGIRFERWTNRGDSDDNIYISRQDGLMIGCCIKDEEKGSPYASDIMSVLESIHHTT